MHDEVKEKVLGLLRGYPKLQHEITLLRYQLDHVPEIDGDEMIASMNFSHGENRTGASNSGVSNKTQNIALNYQTALTRENQELRDGLRRNLHELEAQRDELLRRIGLLDERQAAVLRLYYLEKKTWTETASAIYASERTAQRIRRDAVSELCRIYKALKTAKSG